MGVGDRSIVRYWRAICTFTGRTEVQFDIGSVEGGSSGSPLFNEKKRIVGQLHGGQATVSYFGKLNLSMNSSTLSQQQLAVWLDPTNTGVQVLDGIDSKNVPVAEFSAPITKVCIATPIQFKDLSQLKPIKWHWSVKPATIVFVNSTDSSENPQISFLNEGQYSISLTAVNSNGSNSITHTNYITASNIYVKFNKFHNDTSICGYEIQNFHIVASGASKYTFSTEPSQKFYVTSNFDTVSLTLKNEVKIEGSFIASIRVLGEQGSCSASDSVNFNIVIPPNDDISNSISLKLGENGPYSNNCATVETWNHILLLVDVLVILIVGAQERC